MVENNLPEYHMSYNRHDWDMDGEDIVIIVTVKTGEGRVWVKTERENEGQRWIKNKGIQILIIVINLN